MRQLCYRSDVISRTCQTHGTIFLLTKHIVQGSVWVVIISLLLVGCQTPREPNLASLTLTLSNERVRAGESVVVSWTSHQANSLNLNGTPVAEQGSVTYRELATRTPFRLTATSHRGQRMQRDATVLVDTVELSGSVVIAPLPLPTETPAALTTNATTDDDLVPGEFLVLYADHVMLSTAMLSSSLEISDSPHVRLHYAGEIHSAADTLQALHALPGVIAAVPNRYLQTLATPNDEHYSLQWSLNGSADPRFNLAPMWQVTRGSPQTVIAVVDTGLMADPARTGGAHPDLDCGRLLPGASFLRAPDGSTQFHPDAFETSGSNTNYHGTHVAGIAAACSDNAIGIAGVDPSAQLLPIRVFDDRGAGTLAQVLAAARWAAGLQIPNVPLNPHPADVINFSLGAGGACADSPHPVASVLGAVAATGAILVAAAGNTGGSSALTPANCPSVISVGAVGPDAQVTSYSNRGPAVDVFAPGGAMTSSERERGILSTLADDDGAPAYAFMDGTSMAAPYVAGLIALLRSLHPNIHAQQVRNMLANASDVVGVPCRLAGAATTCDAAVLDPRRLATLAVPPRQATDDLFVSGSSDFGATATELTIRFQNGGSRNVEIHAVTSSSRYLHAEIYGSSTLTTGSHRTIQVTLDRSGLIAMGVRGSRETLLTIETDLGHIDVPLRFNLGGAADIGTITVTAAVEAAQHGGGAIRRTRSETNLASGYQFVLDLDLSGLSLNPGDQLLLQASGSGPYGCTFGETRLPLGSLQTLIMPNLRILTERPCPPSKNVVHP